MSVDQLTEDLEDLKAEIRGKNITVVVPSNRKLSKYDGSTSMEDWIEEVESALDANSLEDSKAANFIVAALSGQARDKVRGREKATRDNPSLFSQPFTLSLERLRLSQLCQLIYSRRQEQHESLLDFAHALTALVDHLSRKGGCKPSEKGVILRNQFIEGVLDT